MAESLELLPRPRSIEFTGQTVTGSLPRAAIDSSLPAQGYRLTIDVEGTRILAADAAGEFYGRATYSQIRRLHGSQLPSCVITDHPDLPIRGVMLDISRDKVPTLQTVKDLVSRLAALKMNHVQLYMEHTFAYAEHGAVWADASPFTAEEIAELDEHCRGLHVELAPNQNCLGHMERWLAHDAYRGLAIRPDGWQDRRGRTRPPTTIDPGKPESLRLVTGLLEELLPNFTSRRVHVGLDEPWELPDERYDEYVAWIASLRGLKALEDHEMLMWGDIVARHPESAATLPDGVTICEWGYESGHPFDSRCQVLADAGREFWVCPGTSSWNTLVGRYTNARDNCRNAAEAGIRHGAQGYLVTDWGDNGHLQYLPFSEAPFAYAAAVSWCAETNATVDVAAAVDAHVFGDGSGELTRALLTLGDAHRGVVPQVGNSSILVLPLLSPRVRMGEGFTEGITEDDLSGVQRSIDSARRRLGAAKPSRTDAPLVLREANAAATLLHLLVRDASARLAAGGRLSGVPDGVRRAMADELGLIADTHRQLWLERNRPGGLEDSLARLHRLRDAYLDPDEE